MENSQQSKKSKLIKGACLVILSLFGIMFLSVALFYFYPVPDLIKAKSNKLVIQRCIYDGGIGYSVPPEFDDDYFKLYNAQGKLACVIGSVRGNKSISPCSHLVCFSFNR